MGHVDGEVGSPTGGAQAQANACVPTWIALEQWHVSLPPRLLLLVVESPTMCQLCSPQQVALQPGCTSMRPGAEAARPRGRPGALPVPAAAVGTSVATHAVPAAEAVPVPTAVAWPVPAAAAVPAAVPAA